ncbi:immunoglobulin-like domain-containing protein [Clostridium intestinale]|uniref:immunoglobulin-like domain-containing protein n=1 Tax=Clostridium intestinale TaxID=36845 RepID=UPI0028E4D1EF|nr:immunoglobulin-like domain-containing protein [Clostridium intestinale]
MSKLTKKKISSLLVSAIFTSNLFNGIIANAAENNDVEISLKPQFNADIVLTVGDSSVDSTSFEADLKAKLSSLGVQDSRIKISGLKSEAVSAEDSFSWNIYDHKGNWGEDNYPNGDGQANPQDNQHIIVKNDGKNIVFYGYGEPGYKDFMFMPNESNSKKSFEFEINEAGINYHSMEGGGFLFNTDIDENGILNGYAILFLQAGVGVYKMTNINANDFHNEQSRGFYDPYGWMGTYPGITQIGSLYSKDESQNHTIKIETTKNSISMWDNGNKTIDNLQLDSEYGNGFGPIASYTSHGCNILSYFEFNNLSMKTTSYKKFKDLIKEPEWEIASKKFVVNLNDTSDSDFHDATAYGEIQSRITSENLHYIGWGTSANEAEAKDLVAKNNSNGIYVDNTKYSDSIDKIATYIYNVLNQESSGATKVLIGQPIDVAVTPSEYKEDTANEDYPLGGWKFNHDDTYYENAMGKATFDGQYMDSLEATFDKPGKYDITFRDNVVTPNTVYAHRLPIASFDFDLQNDNGTYTVALTDKSFDLDRQSQSDRGIAEVKWQWREVTSSTWIDGQIPSSLDANKQYLVQLTVKDYDDAWSNPSVKYISTVSDSTKKSIASFIIAPEVLYTPINKDITIVDNSYDPQGREITEKVWKVFKDGQEIYSGSTPMTDFSGKSAGDYTVTLVVKTADGYSDKFSRTFTVKDVQQEANNAKDNVNIGYEQGDNENSVTKNITLPTTGPDNTLIRWTSSDPAITKYGEVTRPNIVEGDKTVTLTATVYNNGVTSTKTFTVIVKAAPNNVPVLTDGSKSLEKNTDLGFKLEDFTSLYSDSEGSDLTKIKITSIPHNGILIYNESTIKVNDEISAAGLDTLIFRPASEFVGSAEFTYEAYDGYGYSLPAKFTVNVQDSIPATVSDVKINSDNAKSPNYAKEGDTITLTFTASEELSENPKVTILGKEATVTKLSGNNYQATYVVEKEDTQGVVEFEIGSIKDKSNNVSQEVTTTTDNSSIIVETIPPTVSNIVEGQSYKPGVIPEVTKGTVFLDNEEFTLGNKIETEGNHTLVVVDKAGNTTTVNFNIDGTAPKLSDITDNAYYNKPVAPKFNEGTATLNGKPYVSGDEISEEGTYQLIVTDEAGNVSTVNFVIDKTPPTVSDVLQDGQYNKDVNVTFNKGTATLNGKPYTSGTKISEEGTYELVVTDQAGNVSTVNFTIDKTAPIIDGVKNGEAYNKDVEVTFNEGTATLNGKPFESGSKVTKEGQYTIIVVDKAGNISTRTFVIDKTAPVVSGVEDGNHYNNKVNVSFNEGTATLNGATFTSGTDITEEGTYTLVVKDNAGNTTTKTFTIDKTAPVVSNLKSGETYKEDMTPQFNEGTATLDGKPYEPGTPVTEEGSHTLVVKDKAGNTTVVNFTIDKSMPKTLDLKGKVQTSNRPVANAKVTLVDADGKTIGTTTTDENGNYTFKDQKTGLYKVIVNKDGLEQQTQVNLQPTKPTDKEKVQDVYVSKYRVTVTASPNSIVGDGEDATTLTVQVLDENNKPVPGKTVTINVTSGTLKNGNTVITDGNGNALFTLQSSKVSGDDMLTVTVGAKVDGLDVPVTNNAIVHFAPGSIRGVVVDNTTGKPVAGAIVEVSKDFDNNGIPDFYAKYVTGNDGKYKIAIPKGNVKYDVKITKNITIGNISKTVTFNQKTNAGSVSSEGKESYDSANTATGLLLMKDPAGNVKSLDSYTNYSMTILDENGNMVSGILEDENPSNENGGVFNFSGLEKGKTYYAAVYYNLPDGSKIKVGTSKIQVNNDGELNIANCLIDPYGDITNIENGNLISGAHVKLYYADTQRNRDKGIKPHTLVELPTVNDFPPADNLNPQFSDVNGKYAWMVFPHTDYYIVATADGYEDYTSSIITVEEEIVRHDIQMTPIKKAVNTSGDKLVQTGSLVDINILFAIGLILAVAGIVLVRRKETKEN